jgi:hypothetical protein
MNLQTISVLSDYARGGQLLELQEPYLSSHFGQEPQALVVLL